MIEFRTMKIRKVTLLLIRVALCSGLVFLSGCALFESAVPTVFEKEPEFQAPHQMIPVWTDTVLHQTGSGATRGCGGRFMFYTPQGKESIRVDGSVVVYVWDDTENTQQRKPDKKYVFKAEDLQNHYSKSKVGHSYSFWVPWDPAGGNRTELTVVARFVGQDGTDVTTSPSKVILPGPVSMPAVPPGREAASEEGEHPPSGVQQVSWKTSKAVQTRHRQSLRSSEISLTPGFVERNQTAGYSANDLFTEDSSDNNSGRTDSVPPAESQDSDTEPQASHTINERTSARHAARLLQSRFQARRAQVAQRFASDAETAPSRTSLPDSLQETE